ncbi:MULTISPECIES: GlxA family transcriptional regulator [Enterobacteriaceae]|uniref:AraC family transcriptional regulator n=1 Tax=Raoultella ornithinolytica TaxID=54291 RepID=A0A0M5KJM9_RAOOR|nr:MULTISPECIES: DJ-1/PfpI family protein [Enterobacteriaceae]ALJ52260.1 transcriptional regulator containing an amidase domain and an AraC-type DNA-binding HTH domain [uncultured bacterium]ALD82331.1 AraC family transcriptional regulator [Raoultella ornithinolytica]MDI0404948.1 DJ-1/PfpI family protein [Enterobacter ludwigii]MDI0414098.1 DJ-1/PfpI family protein [Enterobacter ludwigii]MDI0418736.1 DJ-1/PfpI family protein [Enterobacter ludwigii]
MRITFLAFPRVQLLDVVGPADVFAEAARQLANPAAYRVEVIGTCKGMLKGSNGLKIGIDKTFETYKGKIDTLLVAGSPHIDEIALDPALQDWLRRQVKSVRRIGSVCSGAFLLAAAGLLDGRHVTTHWSSSAKLAKEHPQTHVHPDSIYIKDGNIYTSAGVTAGMDLALAMVEEDHGRKLALSVAREMVMFFKRPGGQSQFSAQLWAQTAERSVIREVQDYVVEHLKSDLSVPTLAARAGMSERNFARIFKTEVGLTPAEFVELARIDAARRVIEDTGVSLKRLANIVGYTNTDGFRRAFMRRIGVNPRDYRKRFSSV